MRINRIIPLTRAEGPFERFCIWVQGCSRHCKGCFAPHTWDKNGGYEISVQEIISQISQYKDRIEGLTFLGGEPFEQAASLAEIAGEVKKMGLGIICFTGSTLEELRQNESEDIQKLLSLVDILADGDYRQDLPEKERPLLGSENQRFIFMSERYSPEIMRNYKNRFEIHITKQGSVVVNGMGNDGEIPFSDGFLRL